VASLPPRAPEHLMGTDSLGRDVLSRIIYGLRTSLTIAAVSVSIAGILSLVLGSITGYVGGIIDRGVNLVMDALYAFPALVLAMIMAIFLGQGIANIAIAISIAFTPFFTRVIRGAAIASKTKPFIEAAKIAGGSNFYMVRHRILPHCLPSMSVLAAMGSLRAIVITRALRA